MIRKIKNKIDKILLILTICLFAYIVIYIINNYIGIYIFFLIFLFAIISIFIANLLHEFSHHVFSRLLGMKSNVFSVYPLLLVKKHGKWIIILKFKNVSENSGFIIPNLQHIKNNNDFTKIRKKILLIAIVGPLCNYLLFIIFVFIDSNNFEVDLFINIYCVISFFVGILCMPGDGKVIHKIMKDSIFALDYIISLNNYSNNYLLNSYLYKIAMNNIGRIDWSEIKNYINDINIYKNLIYFCIFNENDGYYKKTVDLHINDMLCNLHKINFFIPEMVLYFQNTIIYLIIKKNNYKSAKVISKFISKKYRTNASNIYYNERSNLYILNEFNNKIIIKKVKSIMENSFDIMISDVRENMELKLINNFKKL